MQNIRTLLFLFLLFSVLSCIKFEAPPIPENGSIEEGSLVSFKQQSIVDPKYGQDVYGAAVTNDGLVIVNDLNLIKIWDDNVLVKTINNGANIRGMVLSPDEKWFYVLEESGKVKIYDWLEGKVLKELTQSSSGKRIKLSRDGKTLVVLETHYSNTNNIRIWDLDNPEISNVISFDNDYLNTTDVAVSPDGKYVSACGSRLLKVWERDSEKVISDLSGTADFFHSVEFGADGSTLISKQYVFGNYFWGINIYDFKNQVSLKKIDNFTNSYAFSVSNDGNYCFTVNAYIDLVSRNILWKTPSNQNLGDEAFTVFSSNGKYVACFDRNGSFNLYDNLGTQLNSLVGLFSQGESSTSFENNLYVLAGSQVMSMSFDSDNTKVLDSPEGKSFLGKIAAIDNSIFTKDCSFLYFWNIQSNSYDKVLALKDGLERASWCNLNISKSPDNRFLAVQIPDNMDYIAVYDIQQKARIATLEGLSGYKNGNGVTEQNLVFSNDGKRLFVYERNSGAIKNWDIESMTKNDDILTQVVSDVELAVSADNRILVIAQLGKLKFYDLEDEKYIDLNYDIPYSYSERHFYDIRHLEFNSNGDKVAYSYLNNLVVFELSSKTFEKSITLENDIIGLEWNQDGDILAAITTKNVDFFRY